MFLRFVFILLAILPWPLVLFATAKMPLIPIKSIFQIQNESVDEIITKTGAYSDHLFGRVFNNKASIVITSFEKNLTALIDPNNYFFGFHPREMLAGYLNLVKFPFVTIPIFIYGFINLKKHKWSLRSAQFLLLCILLLSLLNNFERLDFILYFPLVIILIISTNDLYKNNSLASRYLLFSIPIMIIELIREIIIFSPK